MTSGHLLIQPLASKKEGIAGIVAAVQIFCKSRPVNSAGIFQQYPDILVLIYKLVAFVQNYIMTEN